MIRPVTFKCSHLLEAIDIWEVHKIWCRHIEIDRDCIHIFSFKHLDRLYHTYGKDIPNILREQDAAMYNLLLTENFDDIYTQWEKGF